MEEKNGNALVMACEIDSPGVAALDKLHPGQALSLLPHRLHLLFEIGTSSDRCRHVPLAAHAAKRACRVRAGYIVRWLDPGTSRGLIRSGGMHIT